MANLPQIEQCDFSFLSVHMKYFLQISEWCKKNTFIVYWKMLS